MGYVMERPWTDPLSLPWKAGEVTQKEIIIRENKGVVGVEEKLSEGYCPLSSLLAMQTGTTGSLQGILCLCGSVCVCVYIEYVCGGGEFDISPVTNF